MGGGVFEQEVVNGGWISQGFGCTDYDKEWSVSRLVCKDGFLHGGIDIAAPTGRPIRCTRDGVITVIGLEYLGPYAVGMRMDDGYFMGFGHCSKALVTKGERVKAGDVIALVGNLGASFGPHVHTLVRKDRAIELVDYSNPFKNLLDPTPWLTIGSTATLPLGAFV